MPVRLRRKWKCNPVLKRTELNGEEHMSEDKETKKENGEQPVESEEVEGYAYCDSHKQRCLNDCGGNGNATPFLSDLN